LLSLGRIQSSGVSIISPDPISEQLTDSHIKQVLNYLAAS
jgi:hypothetical protein